MMATVPHVTSGSGLRKFQADGFLLDRVYKSGKCNTANLPAFTGWIKHHFQVRSNTVSTKGCYNL